MKFTKTQFKVMMKECLSELINEGAFDRHLESIVESKIQNSSVSSINENVIKKSQDSMLTEKEKREFVKKIIDSNMLPKNPMLAQAMMDTAQTLPERLLSEKRAELGLGNPIQIEQDEEQLKILSGGNMKKWATAAFSKGNK